MKNSFKKIAVLLTLAFLAAFCTRAGGMARDAETSAATLSDAAREMRRSGEVRLRLDSIEVEDLALFLSELLQENIDVSATPAGKISIALPDIVSLDQARETIVATLRTQYYLDLFDTGRYSRLVRGHAGASRRKPVPRREGPATSRTVALKHLSADSAADIVRAVFGPSLAADLTCCEGKMRLTGKQQDIRDAEEILKGLDAPGIRPHCRVFILKHASPSETAERLNGEIVQNSPTRNFIAIPDPFGGTVVVAGDAQSLATAAEKTALLDQPLNKDLIDAAEKMRYRGVRLDFRDMEFARFAFFMSELLEEPFVPPSDFDTKLSFLSSPLLDIEITREVVRHVLDACGLTRGNGGHLLRTGAEAPEPSLHFYIPRMPFMTSVEIRRLLDPVFGESLKMYSIRNGRSLLLQGGSTELLKAGELIADRDWNICQFGRSLPLRHRSPGEVLRELGMLAEKHPLPGLTLHTDAGRLFASAPSETMLNAAAELVTRLDRAPQSAEEEIAAHVVSLYRFTPELLTYAAQSTPPRPNDVGIRSLDGLNMLVLHGLQKNASAIQQLIYNLENPSAYYVRDICNITPEHTDPDLLAKLLRNRGFQAHSTGRRRIALKGGNAEMVQALLTAEELDVSFDIGEETLTRYDDDLLAEAAKNGAPIVLAQSMKYGDAEIIASAINETFGLAGDMEAFPAGESLVLSGDAAQIAKLGKFLGSLDGHIDPKILKVFTLEHEDADYIARQLNRTAWMNKEFSEVVAVADGETRQVRVVAGMKVMQDVGKIVRGLDRKDAECIRVFRLRYKSTAETAAHLEKAADKDEPLRGILVFSDPVTPQLMLVADRDLIARAAAIIDEFDAPPPPPPAREPLPETAKAMREAGVVDLNFTRITLQELTAFVSELLEESFTVPDGAKNVRITLSCPRLLSLSDTREIMLILLKLNAPEEAMPSPPAP